MVRALLPFFRIVTTLLILLGVYAACRLSFFLFNQATFSSISHGELFNVFVHGLRFDISALLVLNSLFLLLLLLPFDTFKHKLFQKILRFIFVITNSVALAFEISDWIYFGFNHKRATADVLTMLGRKGDFLSLLPDFFKLYWYLFLLAIVMVWALYKLNVKLEQIFAKHNQKAIAQSSPGVSFIFLIRSIIFVLGAGACLVGIRGGFQLVPINIRNAVEVTAAQYTPLVLNTPFSIINSFQGDRLERLNYMSEADAQQLIKPVKNYKSSLPFQPKNVVIIIVEGLSKEFTKLGAGKSYTPFLDSLMEQSLNFTNAYANGLHSNEGIPAILAGVPSLMEEPITTSIYSNNLLTTIPQLLKQKGYATAFYHGSTNGSMSFDVFAKAAGVDKYYGRTEYNNEKDYDGSWGIYDEPFLQYFSKGLSQMKQPFNATIFTVTSHHPFPIPAKYKGKFPQGPMPVHESIGYTDYALQAFFEKVKQAPWYNNTLFVITADHCSPYASSDFYAAGAGRYQVPILFFAPGDTLLKGSNSKLMQHVDILPSVMHYLNYKQSFFALGNSAFDTMATRFVINKLSGVYEWIDENYRLKINDGHVTEAYVFPADSVGAINIAETYNLKTAQNQYWKAFLQVYTAAMIDNKMKVSGN